MTAPIYVYMKEIRVFSVSSKALKQQGILNFRMKSPDVQLWKDSTCFTQKLTEL